MPGVRGAGHRHPLRLLAVALVVCLDLAAALLVTTDHLPVAVFGVALAGLGWFMTGRLAAWHPEPAPASAGLEQRGTERPR
jgi:hypothetical protein